MFPCDDVAEKPRDMLAPRKAARLALGNRAASREGEGGTGKRSSTTAESGRAGVQRGFAVFARQQPLRTKAITPMRSKRP
jgi:hypothetical protein